MILSVPCSASARRIAVSTAAAADRAPRLRAAARPVASGQGEGGAAEVGGVAGFGAARTPSAMVEDAARAIGAAASARRVISGKDASPSRQSLERVGLVLQRRGVQPGCWCLFW